MPECNRTERFGANSGLSGQSETMLKGCVVRRPGRRPAGTDPAKRAQIVRGAAEVFTRMGYEAANVGAIAAAAGVSKGTIYVYFEDKLDLFVAVMEDTRDRVFGVLTAELERPGPLRERLQSFGRVLAQTLTSEDVIRAHRVTLGALERVPGLGARFAGGMAKGQSILGRALEGGVAEGALDIPDIELACNQFFELCLAGLFRRRLMGIETEPPTEEEIARVVDAAVDMFFGHYRAAGV